MCIVHEAARNVGTERWGLLPLLLVVVLCQVLSSLLFMKHRLDLGGKITGFEKVLFRPYEALLTMCGLQESNSFSSERNDSLSQNV